jgi:hypothetical protein
VTGDTLEICFAHAGKARPTAFSARPGSGNRLLVLKRDKAVQTAKGAAGRPAPLGTKGPAFQRFDDNQPGGAPFNGNFAQAQARAVSALQQAAAAANQTMLGFRQAVQNVGQGQDALQLQAAADTVETALIQLQAAAKTVAQANGQTAAGQLQLAFKTAAQAGFNLKTTGQAQFAGIAAQAAGRALTDALTAADAATNAANQIQTAAQVAGQSFGQGDGQGSATPAPAAAQAAAQGNGQTAAQNQAADAVTWGQLVELEPQIQELLWRVRMAGTSCRTSLDVERAFGPVKNELAGLIGFAGKHHRHPLLGSVGAYAVAYRKLYEAVAGLVPGRAAGAQEAPEKQRGETVAETCPTESAATATARV